ncbi:amidohydrolase family protein [Cellulomonas aerilata]|uniref:Amidohydrolase n=1 Tax=Cellulomonas aerilata TaxID=515326 RepID=A0A512D8I8_9CELL|nr:amidohydrolase family protein [Cellulomonas aerilata]GEO32786.1 amidohydrolase [Cellulomonas aerilata]
MTESGRHRTVDAHQHFWEVAAEEQSWRTSAHASIDRDYGPDDLAPELAAAGVDATVLMQSVDSAQENDRLAAYAAATPTVAGVVGWLPMQDADAARRELDRAGDATWCGVRCLVARDPMEWLSSPASLALFREVASRDMAWDVVPVTAEQVEAVVRLAQAVPELRVVVDHLARPPLDTGGRQPWADLVSRLAACPGVALKVSVGIDALTAWPSWQPQALRPYVAHALESFGPDRLMLASNWPVVLLRATYGQAWSDLRGALAEAGASDDDLALVEGGTADRWYGLTARAAAHPGAPA